MSTTIPLERNAWQAYFDAVSKGLAGQQVEIEIAALDIGDQIAAQWLPALGVTYDARDDVLAVIAEGLNHLIHHPQQVFVERDGDALRSVHATDADGRSQIIRFRPPPGA